MAVYLCGVSVPLRAQLNFMSLSEDVQLTADAEDHVRANVQKLVEFATKAEKASGATGCLLWSESEGNLVQKLVARLQRVQ